MKTFLGLDLGTNSIGWALIQQNFEEKYGKILGLGSRIIPMSQDMLGDFDKGNSISQTAERTRLRSTRRLRERHLLRRERLHRVLNVLGFLPKHYANKIDFDKRVGKFLPETEAKFAYDVNGQFIFKSSFEEMLADFQKHQPSLVADNKKVPYDWTIYYLRKKALSKKIENEELAWLLLHFNQKRGYYQLRGEETEDKQNKLEEFYSLKIIDVTADEPQKGKKDIWYNIILENGWVYRRSSMLPLFDWKDKVRDFIVTTDLNENGSIKTDKEGNEKRSFRSPKEDDWKLSKTKTENEIATSNKTVGTFIYDSLLQKPHQKIKGKLVRTIERRFYKEELKAILERQIELNSILQDTSLYQACIEELYPHNLNHHSTLAKKDFKHLFVEDILFYQRPLRSQKSAISNCPLEAKTFEVKGIKKTEPLKCIPKSHPLYQEFRLWQWVANLRIFNKQTDENETSNYIKSHDDITKLFDFLNTKKEIDQKTLLKQFKLKESTHRWNYVEDKKYPGNETHAMISGRLEKVEGILPDFLTNEKEEVLWLIIYSVKDKTDYEKALKSFARKNNLDVGSFFEAFRKFPPFPGNYGAYSAKAIKKLLPLMRCGKYWNETAIDENTKGRIDKIVTAEYDEDIRDRVREKAITLTDCRHFQGLPEWLAKYVVYDRHAERSETGIWKSLNDIDEYLKSFRQHSLRNPIVEQIITETLRVVKDIWQHYGNGAESFFDEIHIELGREMKNPAEERKRLTNQITENENTNLRIKALLAEMLNDTNVENVRPYSPMQQEILKIYEDTVLKDEIEIPDDIDKISKMPQPSRSELLRYKLWLEQKYKSPYTGKTIPLNKLFTPAYEIEHVIPQSRYFDDSFSNKVICESAVNKLKGNQTGLEFIQNHKGEIVQINGQDIRIFTEKEYTDFVQQHYTKNRTKKNKLMMLDIPEKMIERQLNDTRYISKYIMQVLSNIVREEKNDDGVVSKNVLPCNGKITSALKQDWGMGAVWNELILPRFERLNILTNTNHFTVYNEKYQKYLPTVPLELQKGFQKKRIDHRHHAMDALVIACATRNHINYLNNQNALDKQKSKTEKQKKRDDLKAILCYKKHNDKSSKDYSWIFKQPWSSFVPDAKEALEKVVVSFKQNLRIINKTVNYYEKIIDGKKELKKQIKGENWAIRKSLHKDTVSGKVELKNIKVPPGKILTATRKSINTSFDIKTIESITDSGIQKILKNYLLSKNGNPEMAFSPEGLEDMNRNIEKYNDGKPHKPIYKARIFELGSKFQLGQTGNKTHKYVEAAKGTNLFFAIYQDENGKRSFATIPLNEVISHQQWRTTLTKDEQKATPLVPTDPSKGVFLFYLSPNDLVYIPLTEENANTIDFSNLTKEQASKIYKTVSASGSQCFFTIKNMATSIVNKREFSPLNKMEKSLDGIMIKEHCIKLSIDRLGNIKPHK